MFRKVARIMKSAAADMPKTKLSAQVEAIVASTPISDIHTFEFVAGKPPLFFPSPVSSPEEDPAARS